MGNWSLDLMSRQRQWPYSWRKASGVYSASIVNLHWNCTLNSEKARLVSNEQVLFCKRFNPFCLYISSSIDTYWQMNVLFYTNKGYHCVLIYLTKLISWLFLGYISWLSKGNSNHAQLVSFCFPILVMPSARLGGNKYKSLCHWFDSVRGLNPTTYQKRRRIHSFGHPIWLSCWNVA